MRTRGRVKWFDRVKGFGFITPEEGGEDLFVHRSAIGGGGLKSLEEGQSVEFDIVHARQGLGADNVTRLRVGTSVGGASAGGDRGGYCGKVRRGGDSR